jgi:hypothetical protein
MLCATRSRGHVSFPSKRSAVAQGEHRRLGRPGCRLRIARCNRFGRNIPMNSQWHPWPRYWWQTVIATPVFGAQPNEGWSQDRSPRPPAAGASGADSGILGQLAQPTMESTSYPLPTATSLLGQLLTGAGIAQASYNAPQLHTEAEAGSYSTPAVGRSGNMEHCVQRYVKCHDLHGGAILRNGKRCEDCFNMCTLYGTWPYSYCPL